MRIIKLGKKEFRTFDEVQKYFQVDLYNRKPVGQFRLLNKKLINKDDLLLFSYEKVVQFTAVAKTRMLENNDELAGEYPYYFVIDMSTVQKAEISLEKVEEYLKGVYDKSIATIQAWPNIPDSPTANALWESLRRK